MKTLSKLQHLSFIIQREFLAISTSYAVLLVLIGGIFVYGLLYNYMYAPNIVTDVPIAIVDNSHSELSRNFIRWLDATPQADVYSQAMDYNEAKEWMKRGKVQGILYLPHDFEARVFRGDESIFSLYATTDAFLYFEALQGASSRVMLAINDKYRPDEAVFLPPQGLLAVTMAKPINVEGTALYNYTEGYGTYLIPAVLIVIMFQTLLMVIGMVSGEERQFKLLQVYRPTFGQAGRLVIGKTFVYMMLYAVFSLFLLGLIPLIFDLPDIGNVWNIIMLLIPFLMATSFFGLTASVIFTDSDAPLLMIAFFSVGLIFLSGVSYPLELMPWYWKLSHFLIPAAPATLAYVKLNSMGASMAEIHTEYVTLWVQCAVYFVSACWAYRYNIRKTKL